MSPKNSVLVFGILVAVFCSRTVEAQSDVFKPTRAANSELSAAQQDLDNALAHLRKVRDPRGAENMRAIGFIELAIQQLRAEGRLYPIN